MPDFSSMPEAFVSNAGLAAAISREVKRGTLRKLASRLYTRNLTDPPEQIVRRNLWPLAAATGVHGRVFRGGSALHAPTP